MTLFIFGVDCDVPSDWAIGVLHRLSVAEVRNVFMASGSVVPSVVMPVRLPGPDMEVYSQLGRTYITLD